MWPFNKKKKIEKHEYSIEDLKWNKMWDLWVKGEIESPYYELMEYLNGVNNGGHCCHFGNIYDSDRDLKAYVDFLTSILKEPLKINVINAYNAFIENPKDLNDENNAILDNCDDVYYQHEEMINEILIERASKIEL